MACVPMTVMPTTIVPVPMMIAATVVNVAMMFAATMMTAAMMFAAVATAMPSKGFRWQHQRG